MLVLTLLVRDEADVVESSLLYHLNAGVDFVIATDHRSKDGSREILEIYERQGVLHLIREDDARFDSQAFRTRMARLAAVQYRADWVIGADADEFFWPRGGSLSDVLAAVPDGFGVVRAPWRFFVPRAGGDPFFAERMTLRLAPPAWLAHPRSPYKPNVKIAHRGAADVTVQGGNHRVLSDGLDPTPWHPIEVLHFPIRSVTQLERKMSHWSRVGRAWSPSRTGVSDAKGWFDSVAISDTLAASATEHGGLVLDTRLRDVLRGLRMEPRSEPGSATGGDERSYRADLAGLADRSLHQRQRRIDDLAERVARLEPARIPAELG